jgi:hypothetical protein
VKGDSVKVDYCQAPFNAQGENEWQPNFSDTRLGCAWQETLGGQEELLFEQSSQLQQLHVFASKKGCKDLLVTRTGDSSSGRGSSKAILI